MSYGETSVCYGINQTFKEQQMPLYIFLISKFVFVFSPVLSDWFPD